MPWSIGPPYWRPAGNGGILALMCGRYTLTRPVEELGLAFGFAERPNLAARYNIAPTQDIPVVRMRAGGDHGGRELAMMRWGLVPFWAADPAIGSRMINARAETVLEKASFRNPMKERRCLIPADGFYEWARRPEGGKQPFRIVMRDRAPFAFAGLWESWKGPKGAPLDRPLLSATIVTTAANAVMAPLHERMPVILGPDDHENWLDPATPADEAAALLRPCPEDWLEAYPVATRVNSVRNDDEACIAPLVDQPKLL
ncbi:MAG TPA: SOS response-associated peptidase [Arenibaculum sp.]|nr:SOS response-associated peptidase [Arenibaculum sp.]